jgi:hypothetical protein
MNRGDNREWCPGSGTAIPSNNINENTSRASCTDCGRAIAVKFQEGSWIREWHLIPVLGQ